MTTQQNDVHPIISWSFHVMQRPAEFVILDTETTDFGGQIVDLAIISGTGDVLFNSLIQPINERIAEGARQIHGISDEMLLDAPTLALCWPQIYDVLKFKQRIICYNASFDSARLSHSCKANGIVGVSSSPGPDSFYLLPPYACLMRQYAEYWDERATWSMAAKWQSLSNALAQQGIEHTNWHRALGDCQATLKLLAHLASLYPVEPTPPPSSEPASQESESAA